jgi:hypothetical protein
MQMNDRTLPLTIPIDAASAAQEFIATQQN